MRAAAFVTVVLFCLTTNVGAALPSEAEQLCPVDAAHAIDAAQEILTSHDTSKLGVALSCVTLALAQTRAELEGLREGRVAFSGQVNAPKGFTMSKPSVQEGR